MTDFDHGAFFADLDAMLAAAPCTAPAIDPALLAELDGIRCTQPAADPRPDIVADAFARQQQIHQENKVSGTTPDDTGQYAVPTISQTPVPRPIEHQHHAPQKHRNLITTSHIFNHENRESVAWRLAGCPPPSGRIPRLAAARFDEVAIHKTWDGTRSKGRRDRVNEAEKFSAAVWSAAAAKGLAVSLNLGIRREAMLLGHADPKRRMTQNLSRHLLKAGLGNLPYAFVFELTPEREGGRLHFHGVIDISGLIGADLERLRVALLRAASEANGAIGGKRQLDLAPLYDPAGWADYLLKDTARTTRELGIGDPFMISKPMRRMAKAQFELLRSETRGQGKTTAHPRFGTIAPTLGIVRNDRQGFTVRSRSDRRELSSERDESAAGRMRRHAHHRPQLLPSTTSRRCPAPTIPRVRAARLP